MNITPLILLANRAPKEALWSPYGAWTFRRVMFGEVALSRFGGMPEDSTLQYEFVIADLETAKIVPFGMAQNTATKNRLFGFSSYSI